MIICDTANRYEEGYYYVKLVGSADGGTVMRGLLNRSGLGFVEGITFEADSSVVQSYGGETFTCGILFNGNPKKGQYSWTGLGISGCTFTGFDYGVYGTAHGYTGRVSDCRFINCANAYYVNSPGLPGAPLNAGITRNLFLNSTNAAITVCALPEYMGNYGFTVFDNLFINNTGSPDIRDYVPGYMYFIKNYFGSGSESASSRRNVLAEENNSARVIVNPCRMTADLNVDGPFWIDSTQTTNPIINDGADSLPIDPDSLVPGVSISVVNAGEEDTPLGVYTFGGGEA